MVSLRSVSVLALVVAAGAVAGLQLGESAIDQIDPVHFGGVDAGFHADLVPQPPSWEPAAQAAAEPVSFNGLGTGCIGCPPPVVTARPAIAPAEDDAFLAPRTATIVPPPHIGYADVLETHPDLEGARASVELYASYPVTQEERAARQAMAAATALREASRGTPEPVLQEAALAGSSEAVPTDSR